MLACIYQKMKYYSEKPSKLFLGHVSNSFVNINLKTTITYHIYCIVILLKLITFLKNISLITYKSMNMIPQKACIVRNIKLKFNLYSNKNNTQKSHI